MTPTYEIQQLLYEVLDRLSRIERKLQIEDTSSSESESDGGVKFSVVSNEKIIEFPKQD